MEELLKEIEECQNSELDGKLFNKMQGEILPGSNVEIFWKGRQESDKGYVFVLPNQTYDEGDFCVHIPRPDNSDGMDNSQEVYIHIFNLISNKRVNKIILNGGFK